MLLCLSSRYPVTGAPPSYFGGAHVTVQWSECMLVGTGASGASGTPESPGRHGYRYTGKAGKDSLIYNASVNSTVYLST